MSVHQDCKMPKENKNLKTLKSYILGFCLALVFTLASFYVAAEHPLPVNLLTPALILLALIQLIVQVAFFLRLNTSKEGRWELMPFLFTIMILVVIVFGSLWIMYNLNYNMGS